MNIFVVRHPIFDRRREVTGYKLLLKSMEEGSAGYDDEPRPA